jgi:hypothetical protein
MRCKCGKPFYITQNYCDFCGRKNTNHLPSDCQQCPVCKIRISRAGVKNHIIGKARNEFYNGDKLHHYKWLTKNI